jgi:hypothetical protein
MLIHMLPNAFVGTLRQAQSDDFINNVFCCEALVSVLDPGRSLTQRRPNPNSISDGKVI